MKCPWHSLHELDREIFTGKEVHYVTLPELLENYHRFRIARIFSDQGTAIDSQGNLQLDAFLWCDRCVILSEVLISMQLPEILEDVFATHSDPDAIFSALLPVLCNVLQTDRCFLYLRNPHSQKGKVAYCWRRSSEIPDVIDSEWSKEPESLAAEEPLFSAALKAKPSVYVEDVETTNPEIVNLEFERKHFGHRALIHAHLCQDSLMWGILQPCIFGKSRVWSKSDRAIVTELEQRLTPLAITYVKTVGI